MTPEYNRTLKLDMLKHQKQMLRHYSKTYVYSRFIDQAVEEWMEIDSAPGITFQKRYPFLFEDLNSLRLCPQCLELFGKLRLDDTSTKKQECSCGKRAKKKWNGYDFNRKYEICYCCGLEVIPSGSKWSSFYCRDCKDTISRLNNAVGQCVLPLSRHSMMNGFSLTGEQAKNPSAIKKFTNNVNKINNKIGLLERHRKNILSGHLEGFLKLSGSHVIELLIQTNLGGLRGFKTALFFKLLALCTNMSLQEVQLLYGELVFKGIFNPK
jgi:hypothetical protein